MKPIAAALAAVALLGVGVAKPAHAIDSQTVLLRYTAALADAPVPKVVVFDYSVSQVGYGIIEERHVLYRSGLRVRDETLAQNGSPLRHKLVKIEERDNRYAVDRLAPLPARYELLFLRLIRDGSHFDYQYEATPLVAGGAFRIDRVTIDGVTFLPRALRFHTVGALAHGSGRIAYAKQGHFWVPMVATVDALVDGKAAREQITWSGYRFPPSLPASTFLAPKPLPSPTLPPL